MTATGDRTQPFDERDAAFGDAVERDRGAADGQDPSSDGAVSDPPRWERATTLFLRWRDGEPRAMDELVRLMTPVLWHVARAYGLDRALAEDVVQSTWMALMRRAWSRSWDTQI